MYQVPAPETSRYVARSNASTTHAGNIPPREAFAYIFDNEGEAVKFLISMGVYAQMRCPFCNGEAMWKRAWPEDTRVLPSRACLLLRCVLNRDHVWSPAMGLVFYRSRKPANVLLEVLYCWANREVRSMVTRRLPVTGKCCECVL